MSQSACSAGESSHLLHVLENDLVLAGFSKVACRRLVEHAIVGGRRVGQTPLIEHALDRRRYHRGGLAHDELEIVVGDEDDGVCICHFFLVFRGGVGVRVRRARLLRSRAANLGLGLGLGLDRLSIAKRELIGMANILPLLGCQLHVNSTPTRRLLQITHHGYSASAIPMQRCIRDLQKAYDAHSWIIKQNAQEGYKKRKKGKKRLRTVQRESNCSKRGNREITTQKRYGGR